MRGCGALASRNLLPVPMPAAVKTTAVKDGNEWVLNGSKIFITNAACELSMGVTVQAVTGTRPSGKPKYTCFLVEHGTPGFKAVPMHKKMMLAGFRHR